MKYKAPNSATNGVAVDYREHSDAFLRHVDASYMANIRKIDGGFAVYLPVYGNVHNRQLVVNFNGVFVHGYDTWYNVPSEMIAPMEEYHRWELGTAYVGNFAHERLKEMRRQSVYVEKRKAELIEFLQSPNVEKIALKEAKSFCEYAEDTHWSRMRFSDLTAISAAALEKVIERAQFAPSR